MSSTITERQRINTSSAVKVPCKAATTANITLLGEQTIDGVSCVTNDRVLVKNQTTASENGIYICNTSGWSRARDWDGSFDVKKGTFVYVTGGTNSGFWYVTTSDPIIPGTTSVTIAQASSQLITFSAFAQLLFDDADAAAARTTLGAQASDATLSALAGLTTAADQLIYATGADAFSVATITAFARTLLDDADAATARTTLGLQFKGAYVYNSAAQSVPNTTSTAMAFNTEVYDTDTFHDNATNNTRLTIPSGVSYVRLKAQASFAANATGDRSISIFKNGAGISTGANVQTRAQAVTGGVFDTSIGITSPVLSVVATDYFEVFVTQQSGGNLNVSAWFALEVVN